MYLSSIATGHLFPSSGHASSGTTLFLTRNCQKVPFRFLETFS